MWIPSWHENWTDLQRSMLRKAAPIVLATAWVGWYWQRQHVAASDGLMALAFVAATICVAIALQSSLPQTAAAFAMVFTPLVTAVFAFLFLGYVEAFPFALVALVLAAFACHPSVPLLIMGALLLAIAGRPGLPQPPFYYWLLLLAVSGLAALLAHDMRTGLRQAWAEADRVADLARQVQMSQEGLNKTNKALHLSNQLLRRTLEELAAAQKEAVEARRSKEQFATTVSHELRTPLNVILGFVEVMQRYPEVYKGVQWTPALRRDVAEVQRNARHLSQLVDDILDLARVQALRMPICREDTDLAALLRESVDIAGRLLRDRPEVRLTLDLPGNLPIVSVDPLRIRQVALNLLANACRFTEKGSVQLSAHVAEGEVVVCVADTGTGIPPEQLEVIFEEFRQAQMTTNEGLQRLGKGLGLAIAKRFVLLHGGRIWATSAVGQGSRFYFALPLQKKDVADLLPPPSPPRWDWAKTPTVVVVDQGEAGARLARHLEHYRVVQVESLAEAGQLVAEQHPQAVIVNVPPQPQGSTITPVSLPQPVPVLTCTLPGSFRIVDPDLFDGWLVKPITADQLRAALAKVLTTGKVLIADDDRSFVHLVRRLLEVHGTDLEVFAAYDGEDALRKAQLHDVDAVLLDVCLPSLDGRAVAARLRAHGHSRPAILAITALLPESEGEVGMHRCFSATLAPGIGEEATLGLLKYCLANLNPSYASQPPSSAPQAASASIPA